MPWRQTRRQNPLIFMLPTLGQLNVPFVSRRDIESLHKSLQNKPYQANRALALLSKMFTLAVSKFF